MKKNIFLDMRYRRILYGLFIILPSVFTGNMYNVVNTEETNEVLLSKLSALSTSVHSGIKESQNHLSYSLTLLLAQEAFTSFDVPEIGKHLAELVYYNPTISNAYIIDKDNEVLYGINDTILSGTTYLSHVTSALEGDSSYYSTYINEQVFTQLSVPIYTTTSIDNPEAALVMTYSFAPLEMELKALNSSSPNINAYLIDINGRVISSSSNHSGLWGNRTLDIKSIIRTLDYDATATFTLFDDVPLMGIYYTVPDTGWTLLITSVPPEDVQVSDVFSWLSGLLSAGFISTAETVRKRKSGQLPIPGLSNIS